MSTRDELELLFALDIDYKLGQIQQYSAMPEDAKKYHWTYNNVYNQLYNEQYQKDNPGKTRRAMRFIITIAALCFVDGIIINNFDSNNSNMVISMLVITFAIFALPIWWLIAGATENSRNRQHSSAAAHEIASKEAMKFAVINEGMYQAAVHRLGE